MYRRGLGCDLSEGIRSGSIDIGCIDGIYGSSGDESVYAG